RGHATFNVSDEVAYLKRSLRPVTLDEIAKAVARGGAPPAASLAVTFDDGYANNAIHALPVLRDLGIPATFFLPSGFIGSTRDLWVSSLREIIRKWPDRPIPEEPGRLPALFGDSEARRHAYFPRTKRSL